MRVSRRRRPGPRFVQRATPFITAAAEASRRLGHNYVGTEHLLLSLAEGEGSAAARVLRRLGLSATQIEADIVSIIGTCDAPRGRLDADALATLGIDLDEVRRRIDREFGTGALERTRAGCTPVCPRLKKALELAARHAGEEAIRPDDVLVAAASVEDSVAAHILATHGVGVPVLQAALADEQAGESGF
jgi:ATP-dependent Clp protease ATP-binding subunit ClpA